MVPCLPTIAAMAAPFRFALQMRNLADPTATIADALEARDLGYEELYSYDHLGAVDPFVPMVTAAAAAPTMRVGPLVLNNELHHPVLLARTAATVDAMTGGRLVLGLGTGYAQDEHDAMGLPIHDPGPRVSRFAESLEIVRSLLDTDAATFDGEFHHVHVEALGIRPAQAHVPFLIGGHGRRVVTLAARHADIFQFTGLTHGERGAPQPGGFALADLQRRAAWFADAAGARDGAIERSALVQVLHVGAGAEAEIAGLVERFGADEQVIEDTPFVLVGSVEQIVDKLERRREDLGISHYVVRDAAQFAPVVAALAGR
jgi:probable F420-dependent oxidoreductase